MFIQIRRKINKFPTNKQIKVYGNIFDSDAVL